MRLGTVQAQDEGCRISDDSGNPQLAQSNAALDVDFGCALIGAATMGSQRILPHLYRLPKR